jgi:hypothetical protein
LAFFFRDQRFPVGSLLDVSLNASQRLAEKIVCPGAGRGNPVSYVVISSFENVDTGDLQAQGEAIAVFATAAPARAHLALRSSAIEAAVRAARRNDTAATFIRWVVMLQMPLQVTDVEEALEDLETIIEETESVDDPFGELVVAYEGRRHAPVGVADYSLKDALRELEAWLT